MPSITNGSLITGKAEAGWIVKGGAPGMLKLIVSLFGVLFAAVIASRNDITPSLPGEDIKLMIDVVSPSLTPVVEETTTDAAQMQTDLRAVYNGIWSAATVSYGAPNLTINSGANITERWELLVSTDLSQKSIFTRS